MTLHPPPPKIPAHWVWSVLEDLCEFNPRYQGDGGEDENSLVSFVQMSSVQEGTGKMDTSHTVPLGRVLGKYTFFRDGDIVFSKITPCMENGKIALATNLHRGIGFGSTEFIVLRPRNGVNPRFILYFLLRRQFRIEAEQEMVGAVGQKRVPTKFLFTYPIPLPPTEEQQKTVEAIETALERVSAGENAALRAKERMTRYREAVISAGVVGRLTRQWRGSRNRKISSSERPGQSMPSINEASSASLDISGFPAIPENWTWKTLNQLGHVGSGVAVSQSRSVEDPIELPYLRVANVLRGEINLEDVKKIRVERSRLDQFMLKTGDILFTEGGDRDKLGRGWIWEGQIEKCLHQNHIFRCTLFESEAVTSKFISYWGNSYGQSFFLRHGTQTTNLASINRSVLRSLPVPMPPLEEQIQILQEISCRLQSSDRLGQKLDSTIAHAKELHESILAAAYVGELTKEHTTETSAAPLLAELRVQRDRPKGKLKKTAKAVTRIKTMSLAEAIKSNFGNSPFTFAALRKVIPGRDYESLKHDLFLLLRNPSIDGQPVLHIEFRKKEELMYFTLTEQ